MTRQITDAELEALQLTAYEAEKVWRAATQVSTAAIDATILAHANYARARDAYTNAGGLLAVLQRSIEQGREGKT